MPYRLRPDGGSFRELVDGGHVVETVLLDAGDPYAWPVLLPKRG